MCCGSRVLGSGGRIAGNQRQNAGPPEVEWLATGAEYRDTGAECRTTGSRMVGFGKRKARNFGVCALLLFVLLLGPPCGRGPPSGRGQPAGRGRQVSRTCTGRRARWLGILPFRVCRRGLRCCGFSPLRGARILSCLSQGT